MKKFCESQSEARRMANVKTQRSLNGGTPNIFEHTRAKRAEQI